MEWKVPAKGWTVTRGDDEGRDDERKDEVRSRSRCVVVQDERL